MSTRYQVDIIGMTQASTPPDVSAGEVNVSTVGYDGLYDFLKGLTGSNRPSTMKIGFASQAAADAFKALFA